MRKLENRERKIQKRFTYYGLGFPLVIEDVPMVKVDGAWGPHINYKALQDSMVVALACRPARLTGSEVRFLRRHFDMTLQEFARLFDYSYQAVMKWEAKADESAEMLWPAELALRLFALEKMGMAADEFLKAYSLLAHRKPAKQRIHRINAGLLGHPVKILHECLA